MGLKSRVEDREEPKLLSQFAPAERISRQSLLAWAEELVQHPVLAAMLEVVDGFALLLNRERQIVGASASLLEAVGAKSHSELVGLRPGEALGCERASIGPNGCGTSDACKKCGALLTVLAAQQASHTVSGHCQMTMIRAGKSYCAELSVKVSRTALRNVELWVCVLTDVTATLRRELLERLFLHDCRNVLMGISGYAEWLNQTQPSEASEQILELARRLAREMDEQQWMLQAELGNLVVQSKLVRIGALLATVRSVVIANETAIGRRIELSSDCMADAVLTDERLLVRVLVNMVMNAVEATPLGGKVVIEVAPTDSGYRFVVSNPGEIPQEIARQLFRVSFSSKGGRRGLGTHAIRLFGEGCLSGKVSFVSDRLKGTRVCFELPQEKTALPA